MAYVEFDMVDQRAVLEGILFRLQHEGLTRELVAELEARLPDAHVSEDGFRSVRETQYVIGVQRGDEIAIGVDTRWDPTTGAIGFLPMRTFGHEIGSIEVLEPDQPIKWSRFRPESDESSPPQSS